jgi:hypothetical protein
MIYPPYLYTLHHPEEGIEPFCIQGPVSHSPKSKLRSRQVSRSPMLQANVFTSYNNALPVSATTRWVDSPRCPAS